MADFRAALYGSTAVMPGVVYRRPCGTWFFVQAFAGLEFAFPFEHGPSNVCELPACGALHHGENAFVGPQGSVVVERSERMTYAGRIDVSLPAVRP